MEEDTSQPLFLEKKGKKEFKTRRSKSKASSSSPSSKKKTAPHNVRVSRARNSLGSNVPTSYSSQERALRSKEQQIVRCLVSSALSPIPESPKKISIHHNLCDALVLGCEDGEIRFKRSKMTRNSLLRQSVQSHIIFGKNNTGASSSRYIGRNEQRKRLSDSKARRQETCKSVIDILDEADEIIDDSTTTVEECMEKSAGRDSEAGKNTSKKVVLFLVSPPPCIGKPYYSSNLVVANSA
jgi:hypothetical protein